MKKHTKDENGLVAIMVATMIMIIMSLVVLGFARLMQREQRQAVDKSLSTQAFYAAESGVNDAIVRMRTTPLANKTDCNPATAGLVGTIDTTLDTSYSCLLINNTQMSLEYTQKSIKTDDSTVVPIRAAGGATIARMELSWGDESSSSVYKSCPGATNSFPASGSWGTTPGIMRLDLIPTAGALTRGGLISSAMNTYLYPVDAGVPAACGAGNSIDYSTGNFSGSSAGKVVPIICTAATTPRECKVDVIGIASTSFYIRMKSIYDGNNATIKIYNAAGIQLGIEGAQVLIDSTGRVADVVRRIQVRVPVRPTYEIPDAALETTLDICKQLSVVPTVSATQSPACAGF